MECYGIMPAREKHLMNGISLLMLIGPGVMEPGFGIYWPENLN